MRVYVSARECEGHGYTELLSVPARVRIYA